MQFIGRIDVREGHKKTRPISAGGQFSGKQVPNPLIFKMKSPKLWQLGAAAAVAASLIPSARASESDINIPDLNAVSFMGGSLTGSAVLMTGLVVCVAGMVFGWMQYIQTRNLPVHSSMSAVSNVIWETCKTYLWQQGKFLVVLWILIAACIAYYFYGLSGQTAGHVVVILLASILGILGSYGVAWFGIRINTVAN